MSICGLPRSLLHELGRLLCNTVLFPRPTYHCNVVVTKTQFSDPRCKRLLLDCGSDIRFSLHDAGIVPCQISDIYISHLHSDHIGGLEFIGFNTLFNPNCIRPGLYGSQEVLEELWERSLAGGMWAIQGKTTTLETFFQVHAIGDDRCFIWVST